MKALKFLGNRVEDAANAFIDVLKYLLNKLIADEEHHIKLIKEAMGVDDSTKKGVTVIIK